MEWSVIQECFGQECMVYNAFQWSWEFAYILRAKSSKMLCEKHI